EVVTETRKIPVMDGDNVIQVASVVRDITAQVRSREELCASEERFRRLSENALDMIYRMSLPDGTYEFVSPAAARLTGYEPREWYETPGLIRKILHPDWTDYFRRQWDALLNGHMPSSYEYQIVHRNGEVRWLNQRNVLIEDADGWPIAIEGIVTDVTDAKLAEQELEGHLRFLENVARVEGVIRNTVNLEDLLSRVLHEVRSIFECDRVWLLYPCDPDVASWQVPVEDTHPDYPGALAGKAEIPLEADLAQDMRDSLRQDSPLVFDSETGRPLPASAIRFGTKSQMQMALDPKVDRPWLLGIHQCSRPRVWTHEEQRLFGEIGNRLRTALAGWVSIQHLRENEEKFRSISDFAQDAIVMMDHRGRVTFWNKAAATIFGWTSEEIEGGDLHTLLAPEDLREVHREAFARFQITGEGAAVGKVLELQAVRRDGTRFPIELSLSGVKVHNQWHAVGIVRDITERKRLQEFADRAKRLETAGRIAGQVAHDFNNLLGPLVAYPDLIRDELGNDHPAARYVDSMAVAAQQIADINQQLLTLGRRGHYNQEPISVNQVIKIVMEGLGDLPVDLRVEVDLADNLLNIRGGQAQIVRVISNLIANARDSMGDAGFLSIRTQNWYTDTIAGKYGQIAMGEYVKVTIEDTGCGISDEALMHVFEPFYTSKKANKRRGSGLGLSVVHAVVKDHNGFVD
ncbi:MAG: PAS domain S-box protein, partial [candidate division Zixibacteria bacterium]|nr:PAS domain S-box protein [candidate division Zixibacteria bacterium]